MKILEININEFVIPDNLDPEVLSSLLYILLFQLKPFIPDGGLPSYANSISIKVVPDPDPELTASTGESL